ncbi:hypothetical protein Glove_89g110 [Diversispora epigaea]|uniref:separase n=1 Tax=Diversispora epigaea TaxID=1348612 RepID=A0A397J5L0_9GLOM|nr:hypothetical protein Glove_89g110 [Diversispora epigaea]
MMDSSCRWKEGDPLYRKLKGPNQWPDEKYIPKFKFKQISLSLELSYDVLNQILDPPDQQMKQREISILLPYLFNNFVKYPPQDALDPKDGIQGVGPHQDPWLTFLLQVNDDYQIIREIIDNTFIVNIGTGLEGVTEIKNGLSNQDLYIYFGHGSGEQYIRNHHIRSLDRCAVTLLLGCSSGHLKNGGEFDPSGAALSYMIAGWLNELQLFSSYKDLKK